MNRVASAFKAQRVARQHSFDEFCTQIVEQKARQGMKIVSKNIFNVEGMEIKQWLVTMLYCCCIVSKPLLKAQDTMKVNKDTLQVIKKKDTVKTPPSCHISYSSTAIANNNTDNVSFVSNNSLRFNVAKDNVFLNTTNSWIYGSQTEGLTNNDYFSSLDFNVFQRPSALYYWGLFTYEKSFSLKINDRFQGGGGIGYEVMYRPEAVFVVSDGLLYEESSLYDKPKYEVLRNSFRVKYKFVFKKSVTLEGIHFWQQALSSWEDYILKSNNALSFKLNTWLSLTATVTYNRLNITQKENLLINVGLTFDKYF